MLWERHHRARPPSLLEFEKSELEKRNKGLADTLLQKERQLQRLQLDKQDYERQQKKLKKELQKLLPEPEDSSVEAIPVCPIEPPQA